MILFALGLACLTSDRFETRYAEEFCQYAKECEVLDLEGFSTSESCQNEASILPDDCDSLAQKEARKCLKNMAALTCEAGYQGIPKACNNLCD